MTRRFALAGLILAVWAGIAPAHAWIAQKAAAVAPSGGQVLATTASSSFSTSADRYLPVGYSAQPASTEPTSGVIPVAGSITSVRFAVTAAPTGAQTWAVTLRKNGADEAALTCTITSASSGKCSDTGTVTFAAGDTASWVVRPTNSPGAARGSIAAVFAPTTANDTIIVAQGVALSNSSTQAVGPFNNGAVGTPANRRTNTFPDGGTIDQFFAISNAPGAGTSYAYTVDKNAATQALTCSITDAATTCNDTTNSFTVAGPSGGTAGDDVEFQAAPTATPAAATTAFGARFRPDTVGSFPFMAVHPGQNHATNTIYYPLSAGAAGGTATEANEHGIFPAMTITKIAVKLDIAPSTGDARVYTLRKNGVDTGCTVTIADTATAATAACSITVADDDLLATSDVVSGTPAVSRPAISYLANR